MMKLLDFGQVKPLLDAAKDILIVLSQKTDSDRIAAGLSLHLALKRNKSTSIFCAKPMTVEFSSLVGVDQIKQKLQGKNLTISFDYVEGSVEKVSYNIENNKFNLLIQPKEGFPVLSTENIDYHYFGQQPDLIFVIGARSLADLGEIYFQNKKLFEQTQIVNLDISSQNQHFGRVNLVEPNASSFSEIVTLMLVGLNLDLDNNIAGNLLTGIQTATAGFSLSKAGVMAFEAAALCLKAGTGQTKPKQEAEQAQAPYLKPMPAKVSAKKAPAPSPDWLEPKIYKGNTLI